MAPIGSSCAPRAFGLPSYGSELDLQAFAGCASFGAQPFGLAYTPGGERLYAALFGGLIGSGGCTLARIDPQTFQVLTTVATGESPEEIAFVTHPDGSFRYGFVTNGSASSVTVFDAADQLVASVPIPFDAQATYPTAFPFGLAVHPDQSCVYVGTQDGQGFVHALDVDSLSLDPSRRIELGAGHGAARLCFAEGRLVIPAAEYLPAWAGAIAKLFVVDPSAPAQLDEVVLASHSAGLYFPSPQDVAIDCDGRAWVAGFDMGARVFAVDLEAAGGPRVVRRIQTHSSHPAGKFQGLGLSLDGLLCVADVWTNELCWIDVRRGIWLQTTSADDFPAYFRAPQDVLFSPDGTHLLLSWAASDNLCVLQL